MNRIIIFFFFSENYHHEQKECQGNLFKRNKSATWSVPSTFSILLQFMWNPYPKEAIETIKLYDVKIILTDSFMV